MNEPIANIQDRVKKVIIERLDMRAGVLKISGNTPLIGKGLGLDSASLVELVVAIEEEFQIMIDEEDINVDLLRDINSLSDYVCKKLESQ